ncbi:hypothetical protein ACRALDRAFT_2043545 [Sodiomyces alcalophilus JCM 7366]|uniref:uncharacterized protein n=1 Tax=Sodiomyces alcalophilus JCM 7366 TaxID=591952 RepID=UPI0039B64AFF
MGYQPDCDQVMLSKKRTWAMYVPAVSSPLNPSCNSHGKKTRERSEAGTALRTTTSGGEGDRLRRELSPTERLLRQKAAIAWLSIRTGDQAAVGDGAKKKNKKKKKTPPGEKNARPPIHRAHWDDQDDQFFVCAQGYDNDDDDDDGAMNHWTVTALTDISFLWPFDFLKIPMTRRSLLVAMLCLGSCIPALAILSSNGLSAGIWALRQPTVRALARQAASLDVYRQ